jgi:transmembrane sensor
MKPDPAKKSIEKEAERIAYLLSGFMQQTLSEIEHDELDAWMTSNPNNQRLFEELTDPDILGKRLVEWDEPVEEIALEKIKERLQFSNQQNKGKRVRMMRYSIAASVILLAGIYFIYTLMNRNDRSAIEPLSTNKDQLQPGGNNALLILANGDTVNLAAAKNGLIDSSSGSEVMKTADGQLSYENPEARILAFHTLHTPVGGQYSLTLPDGSRVWLNSSSRLKYPVAFTGKDRIVELEGEAYFEITSLTIPNNNQRIPFIVKVADVSVEVLGTRFNINAYADENSIRTTLVEGRIRLETGDEEQKTFESKILQPGEQAMVQKGNIEVKGIEAADMEEVLSWKNGVFRFRDESIESIMRQVGRWYGSEVQYEGKIEYHFNATILRGEPVARLLEVLEETGRVKFKIDGRKIMVSP